MVKMLPSYCLAFVSMYLCGVSFGAKADPIELQAQKAFQYIYNNLSTPGISQGVIIASPTQSNPNYFYHWVRDAGITARELVQMYAENPAGDAHNMLKNLLLDWLSFEEKNQALAISQSSLGEPIFTVQGQIYPYPWGRPQNDGPAIRALTFIEWAEILLKEGEQNLVARLYQPSMPAQSIIKVDLEYIAHHWSEPCFDLWEEVKGQHFFTLMAQRAALSKGAMLAKIMSDPGAASYYLQQAKLIEASIIKHWDPTKKIIVPTIYQTQGWRNKASGLDTSVLIASLYFSLDDKFFTPESNEVINTANAILSSFQTLYTINSLHLPAVAIGRYPEDVYNGSGFSIGNPWFLTTHAFAEFYCRMANSTQNNNLRNLGKKFLLRSIYHADRDGHMSEQFNRDTGYLQGAHDLTWSYASYLRASRSCVTNATKLRVYK